MRQDDTSSGAKARARAAVEPCGLASSASVSDLCGYIADMILELKELAETARLPRLAVVLDVAHHEAASEAAAAKSRRRSAPADR